MKNIKWRPHPVEVASDLRSAGSVVVPPAVPPPRALPHRVLEDNPFAFRPAQTRLAVFRAKSTYDLGLAPSSFYSAAHDYFTGHMDQARWKELGLQGIADLAARIRKLDKCHAIASGLIQLAPEPFVALCNCLESERISADLARAIAARTELALFREEAAAVIAAGIRGLSRARSPRISGALVDLILGAPPGADIEVLASVAGRAWELLDHGGRRERFLERLARSSAGQQGFDAIVSDLLFLPACRGPVLSTLRDPQRSTHLARRLGVLFASAAGGAFGSAEH